MSARVQAMREHWPAMDEREQEAALREAHWVASACLVPETHLFSREDLVLALVVIALEQERLAALEAGS